MKTVVCFGDSNTWGFDPETKERFPLDVRWTGVLAKRVQLLVSEAQPPQMVPKGMVLSHAPTQEIE